MILLSPSKEMSKDGIPSHKIPTFQKEAEELLPEIQEKDKYEAWSLYHGLAFRYLKKGEFSEKDLVFMEKNLCIFSALYGLLSAKDGISEYRLDFSKKGRGAMARYLILSHDTSIERIKKFKEENFKFREDLSTEKHFVFVR